MSRRPLIAGNWKMNGLLSDGTALAQAVAQGEGDAPCDILICPPVTLLGAVKSVLSGSAIHLGAQDALETVLRERMERYSAQGAMAVLMRVG
ncbi:MAG TPA: triose-phosphate isomerase, partial [Rhodospirillaceae bacterium]|nr:triose-phosphate isomerase [Rhodospirillaceae bacterium]